MYKNDKIVKHRQGRSIYIEKINNGWNIAQEEENTHKRRCGVIIRENTSFLKKENKYLVI